MPSNKTLSIIIVCLAIVFSVWLVSKDTSVSSITESEKKVNFFADTKVDNGKINDDWKSLLSNVDYRNEKVVDLTNKSKSTGETTDTTLTAQISKDLMSQYLLLKKGGGELSAEEMANIVANITASQNYTAISAPVYIASNLKVTSKNDTETHKKYNYNVNLILKVRSAEISEDPTAVIIQITGSNSKNALARLTRMIEVGKNFIGDMLIIEVPQKAVKTHLELVNSVSKLITSAEAAGQVGTDPIRSLAGIKDYNNHVIDFQNAVKKMQAYLAQN